MMFLGTCTLWAQRIPKPPKPPVNDTIPTSDSLNVVPKKHSPNTAKTAFCYDELDYVMKKDSLLGNVHHSVDGVTSLPLYQDSDEKLAQTFLNSTTLNIQGVNVLVARDDAESGLTYGDIKVSIYNVDDDFKPTTSLGSKTRSVLTDYTQQGTGHHTVYFSSEITVTGNYAVVVEVETAGGVMIIGGGKFDVAVPYYEGFSHHYTTSTVGIVPNVWTSLLDNFATDNGDGTFTYKNSEPMVSPIVDYEFTVNGTVPAMGTTGTEVAFANTSDMSALNRMTSLGIFNKYWKDKGQLASDSPQDSVFVWKTDASADDVYAKDLTHTYTEVNTYTPKLTMRSGFYYRNTCADAQDFSINITLPDCSIDGASLVCPDASITLTPSTSGVGLWGATPAGVVNVAGGVVTAPADAVGGTAVTITYEDAEKCIGTATHPITISTNCTPCTIDGDASVSVCIDSTITLTPSTTDGQWAELSAEDATIIELTNGVVKGLKVGTATVSYGSSATCLGNATKTIIVKDDCKKTSVGINESDAFASVTIAPNPTNSMITIAGLPDQATITVSDLNGKTLLVQHTHSTQAQLSLDSFVNGVYLVNIQSEEINGVRKIVLNK